MLKQFTTDGKKFSIAVKELNNNCTSVLKKHGHEKTKQINEVLQAPWFDSE